MSEQYVVSKIDTQSDKVVLLTVNIAYEYFRITSIVHMEMGEIKSIVFKDLCIIDLWKYIDEYPHPSGKKNSLSVNPNIHHSYFSMILDRYGIKLKKINFHNWTFIESNSYEFSDNTKLTDFKDRIIQACRNKLINK